MDERNEQEEIYADGEGQLGLVGTGKDASLTSQSWSCQCPLGFEGQFCQHHIDVNVSGQYRVRLSKAEQNISIMYLFFFHVRRSLCSILPRRT